MPTFATGSGVGDSLATILFTYPNVDWFKWAILGAIRQMTLEGNWTEQGDAGSSFAVEESEIMIEGYKVMNFNPFPVGMIVPWGASAAPDGYLLCDGGSYAIADYPELYAVIGTNFGGTGSDFNAPSLINRVVVGAGDIYSDGDTGGEAEVFLDIASMPNHSHNDLGHTHTVSTVIGLPAQAGVGFTANQTIPLVPSNTGIGFAAIDSTGGSGAHDNMQPYQAVTYIIYAGR